MQLDAHPRVLPWPGVQCLDEDLITDLAAGRLRLDADGIEEHLAGCAACATVLGSAVAQQDRSDVRSDVRSGVRSPAIPGRPTVDAATVPHLREPSAGGGRRALQPGTVLKGTYIVRRLIGSGGMGEVYEVDHVRLAGRYAVKVLLADISGDEELLARFRREAEITSALRHPHIVQVIDFDRTDDGCVFLAMEHLEGCDLATLIAREGKLALPRVLTLTRQVVSALSAAHRRGIIHRDLKPANVFVQPDEDGSGERVKLMDFGLSKWIEGSLDLSLSLSRDQALIGTPRYMAPEQARGRNREVSAAADQFALGAMIYEMLAGQSPFNGETLGELLHGILYESPRDLRELRPELPPAVNDVVARALAKSPEKRFPSIQELLAALEQAAAAAGRAPGWWQRRGQNLAAGAVVVAAAAGVALVLGGALDGVGPRPGPSPERASAPAPSLPTEPAAAEPPPAEPPAAAAETPTAPLPVTAQPPAEKPRPRPPRRRPASAATRPAPATAPTVAPSAEAASAAPAPEPAARPDAAPAPRRDQDLIESL